MELRQLKHFLEVVRCASFGRAAEKLFLTQPALSKSIKNLEDSLGVKLLERYPKGVETTEYGRVLFEFASMVTAELKRTVDRIEEIRGFGKHTIRVGTGSTLLRHLLPSTVRRFRELNTDVTVSIRQGLKEQLMPMLLRGELDLMISSVDDPEGTPEIASEVIFEDELVIVADSKHPLAGAGQVALSRLAEFDWVLPEATEAERDTLTQALKRAGLNAPKAAVRTASSTFMASFIRGTRHLSYLPRVLVGSGGAFSNLAVISGPEVWPPVSVAVSYRRRGVMLLSTRRFIDCVIEMGRELHSGSRSSM